MSETRPESILLGYRPRVPWVITPGFDVPGVVAVASASNCLTTPVGPPEPDWDQMNTAYHFPSVESAMAAVRKADSTDARIHATSLFPIVFEGEEELPVTVHLTRFSGAGDIVVPAAIASVSLGFDVVSVDWYTLRDLDSGVLDAVTFECAPLSCNGLGIQHPVNRWCLLDTWDQALKVARRFARDQPEPGSYVVVEVHEVKMPPTWAVNNSEEGRAI